MYEDTYYKHLECCDMHVPISSIIGQLVMRYMEKSILANSDFNLPFFNVTLTIAYLLYQKTIRVISKKYYKNFSSQIEIGHENKLNLLDLTLFHHLNKFNVVYKRNIIIRIFTLQFKQSK